MNFRTTLITLSPCLLFCAAVACAAGGPAPAADTAAAAPAKAQSGAQAPSASIPDEVKAEYERALAEAEKSQQTADAALEKARQELQRVEQSRREEVSRRQAVRTAEQQAVTKMRESLSQAHRQLRATSREVARISRELARAELAELPAPAPPAAPRPVLGIILGQASADGVRVLGVSPDGPAERAGVEAGDMIVAIGKHTLTGETDAQGLREHLREALRDMKADAPVTLSLKRDDKTMDISVVPKVRQPLTWQAVIRLPSAPAAPAAPEDPMPVERIDIPEVDTDALRVQIDKIRAGVDKRRALIDAGALEPSDKAFEFTIDSDDLSELGDFALQDVNAWFGMPLTAGLQLATVSPELGRYFKTDRGVLVLEAKPDNALQLNTGDVVLNVGSSEVNSPADLMRALRGFEPDDEVQLDVKRDRRNKTIKVKMPKQNVDFSSLGDKKVHNIT
ncbi:MAG: PDZ domain-containing protein, partial [Lysobacterales bacterium]